MFRQSAFTARVTRRRDTRASKLDVTNYHTCTKHRGVRTTRRVSSCRHCNALLYGRAERRCFFAKNPEKYSQQCCPETTTLEALWRPMRERVRRLRRCEARGQGDSRSTAVDGHAVSQRVVRTDHYLCRLGAISTRAVTRPPLKIHHYFRLRVNAHTSRGDEMSTLSLLFPLFLQGEIVQRGGGRSG